MLTPSQQQALDTSRHLSVTANAGSGKTKVLVERYINILLSGRANVHEVVAITFTDKAASELRRKISDTVSSRIIETSDLTQKRKLEEVRDQLSGAVVGTIHWFCSKILREHPIEAGVDAAFIVPELIDQRIMLDAAVKETFDAILKETPGHTKREELFEVLRVLGRQKVREIVHALIEKRDLVGRWLSPDGVYARSDDGVLALWRRTLSSFVESERDDPQLAEDLRSLIDAARGKTLLTVRARFKALMNTKGLSERTRLFAELMELMLTKEGELRQGFFGSGSKEQVDRHAHRLREKFKSLLPLLDFVIGQDDLAHKMLLSSSRTLLDLYQNAIERYEQKKDEMSYLDFDDLQSRMKNLLRNESVRTSLSQRYKFLMVDEYQDTNTLQYEILLPLVNELSTGNLFIVGDPKQSIYGFRDADVSVFNRTKADIGDQSGVILNESFRLLRDIAAFVNLVFEPLMQSERSEYEVGYERLICGRPNDASGRVELILRERQNDDREAQSDKPLSEFELIARRLLQLCDENCEVFDKGEKPHAARFRDVAVLMRSRTGLGELEEAFIHHHIPYLISGGIGYFQTQGMYDFYNYFRFLLNSEDDVALAGVLRSPFFNVSDAELFELAFERKSDLWNTITSGARSKRFSSVGRAVEILSAHRDVAFRLSVPELIHRIIDETAYAGFVQGSVRADQTFANVEKLKRIARRYEQQGFTNLYDFVRRLQRLIEEEKEEGQATVDVLADAVKIMTIHAAKGLEFPIVIVPTLDRHFQYDDEPFLDGALGMAFSASNTDEKMPILQFLKRKSRAKSWAEEKRVLYVACTRARDMLILSGTMPKSRSTNNYMNWLLDNLGIGEGISESSLEFDVRSTFLREEAGALVRSEKKHTLKLNVLREKDLTTARYAQEQELDVPDTPKPFLEPILAKAKGEIFSASKIRTYTECPSKYFLRYVIGLPAMGIGFSHEPVEEEADVSLPAELRGRAFHYVMQYCDELKLDASAIVSELRKYVQRDSLTILSEPSIELEAIAQSVMRVLQSEFWNSVKRGTDARTEFTLMAPLGEHFLTGTVDRIYKDAGGDWHILDYKTDSITRTTLQTKPALYEPQLRFYAILVKRLLSARNVHAHLLFTAAVDQPVHYHYASQQLDLFESEIHDIILKIARGEFHRPIMPCSDCPLAPEGCSFENVRF